jgi:hypothetical protein
MFSTSGTYPWSYETQLFHSGKLTHGNTFEVMTLASLLVEALYQGNPNSTMYFFRNLYHSYIKIALISSD